MPTGLFQATPLLSLFIVLLLYVGIPLFLIVAAWRWAAAMLGELRAIRRDLDEMAASEREHQRR